MTLALVLQRGESKHEMAEYHAKILFHLIMRLLSFLVWPESATVHLNVLVLVEDLLMEDVPRDLEFAVW